MAASTERMPSAQGAAGRTNPCRSNRAAPACGTRPSPRGRCRSPPLRGGANPRASLYRSWLLDSLTESVLPLDPVTVRAGLDLPPPLFVGKIPIDGLRKAIGKRCLRAKPELAAELVCADRVPAVVPGPVLHESHQLAAASACGGRTFAKAFRERPVGDEPPINLVADHSDEFDVRHLLPAADIIGFALTPLAQNQCKCRAMILDMEPIADVAAIAINRQRLPGDGVKDRQRNELFGKLIGPVIVGAIADRHRQAVRV